MTKIEWCDETINPVIGCNKISPACQNCYAEVMARRLAGMKATKQDYSQVLTNGHWNGKTVFRPNELQKPFKWKKPRKIFIASEGDLFHETIEIDWLARIFATIFLNIKHTFIILTKRPERAEHYFKNDEFWFLYHKYCNQFHDKYINPLEQELYFYDEIKDLCP